MTKVVPMKGNPKQANISSRRQSVNSRLKSKMHNRSNDSQGKVNKLFLNELCLLSWTYKIFISFSVPEVCNDDILAPEESESNIYLNSNVRVYE